MTTDNNNGKKNTEVNNKIDFKRVNNDINGNPRYVCHFYALVTDKENKEVSIEERYKLACKRANKIGGRKFHNKQYGGGIVFQSYNIQATEKAIHELMNQYK